MLQKIQIEATTIKTKTKTSKAKQNNTKCKILTCSATFEDVVV